MPRILVASDASSVHDEIRSVLEAGDVTIGAVRSGADVLGAIRRQPADLIIVDLQIGNMGGMATALDIRLEEGAGRLSTHTPILMLLDRRADVFLARRSDVEGWLLKPLDPIRLRRAFRALLDGGTFEDPSYRPEPVVVGPPSDTMPADGK